MKIGVSFPTTEVGNDPIVMRDLRKPRKTWGMDTLLRSITSYRHAIRPEMTFARTTRSTTPFTSR